MFGNFLCKQNSGKKATARYTSGYAALRLTGPVPACRRGHPSQEGTDHFCNRNTQRNIPDSASEKAKLNHSQTLFFLPDSKTEKVKYFGEQPEICRTNGVSWQLRENLSSCRCCLATNDPCPVNQGQMTKT